MTPEEHPNGRSDLTRGRLLAKNTLLNLGGTAILFVTAIVAIPLLVDELGTARFGLLTLAWALVGTFGVLDLGLGRALTREVARRLGGERGDLDALISTFLLLLACLGIAFAAPFAIFAPTLVSDVLDLSGELRSEAVTATRILAAALPLAVVTTGLRGLLEAHQRFDLVNALRVPTGVLTVAGPLAATPFTDSIAVAIAIVAGVRLASLVGHAVCCVAAVGLRAVPPRGGLVVPALRSAGWITAANVTQPLLAYPDRFIIAATLSASAVAYYAAPHDLATKLVVIPAAPIPVLFPAFATSFATGEKRSAWIFSQSVRYMALFLVPLVLVIVTFAEEGLDLWLGEDFADEGTLVLQLLVIGVLCQSLAQIPFVLLQGAGRADLTAKLLLAEVIPYLLALWIAVEAAGIEGAAAVWMVRALVDGAALYAFAIRMLGLPGRTMLTPALAFAAVLLAAAALVALPLDAVGSAIALAVSLAAYAAVAWRWLPPR